jgi:hypothetical protein
VHAFDWSEMMNAYARYTKVKCQGGQVSFLYRGVSEELYQKLGGKLTPKKPNTQFASFACAGEPHAVCGSGIVCGESDLNSVILHQWEQAGIPTSGISTSPSVERAQFYALNGGRVEKGYIFKLGIKQQVAAGVSIYKLNELVPYPAIPDDNEHVLIAEDFGNITESAVLSVKVVSNGI